MSSSRTLRAGLVGAVLLALTACGAGQSASPADVPSEASSSSALSSPQTASSSPAASAPAEPSSPSPAAPAVDPSPSDTAAPAVEPPSDLVAPPTGPVLAAAAPTALSVPAIGINSPLIELGRNADGTVEVPSLDDPDSKPGWYRNSPVPGTLGPAIILGHVDSREYGPGVFYSLQNMKTGDSIDVSRADGTVAEFVVDKVESVQKSEFPTLEVYGNLDHSGLRLITCGGEFDPEARSYESNIIVFASLAGSRAA
jgi:LPXTG-site transpeptidase (sortase) family protein